VFPPATPKRKRYLCVARYDPAFDDDDDDNNNGENSADDDKEEEK